MNQSPDLAEFVAVGGALMIAVLVTLARGRVSSRTERMKIQAAAWSLLSDTEADVNDGRARAQETESRDDSA